MVNELAMKIALEKLSLSSSDLQEAADEHMREA
jgi:hypothetical protein